MWCGLTYMLSLELNTTILLLLWVSLHIRRGNAFRQRGLVGGSLRDALAPAGARRKDLSENSKKKKKKLKVKVKSVHSQMGGTALPSPSQDPQFPVWDALNRATAATSRQPGSDGTQASDAVSVVWITRRPSGPSGRTESQRLSRRTGGLADECSGVLQNGRNPMDQTRSDRSRLWCTPVWPILHIMGPVCPSLISSLLVSRSTLFSIQAYPSFSLSRETCLNPIHFYREQASLFLKILPRLPCFLPSIISFTSCI